MKIKFLFFAFLLFSIGISCRKDKTNPKPHGECADFIVDSEFVGVTSYTENGEQFKTPYFNPNNSDEFVYYFKDASNQEYALFKYNITSGQKTKLANNVKIISQPKWGINGWIAFDNVLDYQISIVKENGDSLLQISNNIANLYPAWSADGSYLLWQHSPFLGYPYYLFKKKLNMEMIDTVFSDYAGFNDISSNNVLLSRIAPFSNQQIYFGTANLNAEIVFETQLEIGFETIQGLCWHPDGLSFFFTNYVKGGVKKFNTYTNNIDVIMSHCDSKYFKNPSCSSDGKKLIFERVDQTQELDENGKFTGKILQKSSIVILDLLTLEETKINLD